MLQNLSSLNYDPEQFKNYCLRVFSKVEPRSTFLSIKNYKNNYGELSNFSVCFHVSYENLIKKSINIVKNYKPKHFDCKNKPFNLQDLKAAKDELIWSFNISLSNDEHPLYTCNNTYCFICGADGKPIKGVRLHPIQNVLHINAIKVNKKIIKKTNYPKYNSSNVVLAKRYLKSKTPISKWVQFKLEPGKFDELVVQKMKLKGKL